VILSLSALVKMMVG